MSTKSISKIIVIDNEKECEDLINAIESSCNRQDINNKEIAPIGKYYTELLANK